MKSVYEKDEGEAKANLSVLKRFTSHNQICVVINRRQVCILTGYHFENAKAKVPLGLPYHQKSRNFESVPLCYITIELYKSVIFTDV